MTAITNDPEYAPFDEIGLTALMGWHNACARLWKPGSANRLEHEARAAACKNALAGHLALRERFLAQTMELRAAKAEIERLRRGDAAA